MKKNKKVRVEPKKVLVKSIVKEEEWVEAEIQKLKDIYQGRPYVEFTRQEITDPLLQKAIRCSVIVSLKVQHTPTVILHMAQTGLDLIETL